MTPLRLFGLWLAWRALALLGLPVAALSIALRAAAQRLLAGDDDAETRLICARARAIARTASRRTHRT